MRRYNPNTKYGRKKFRQEFENKQFGTPEEQKEYRHAQNTTAVVLVIVFVLFVLFKLLISN
jgi:hypothetical protein